MRALVVFESMFGNTEKVARAVGDGLQAGGCTTVEVVRVGRAPTTVPDDVDLVFVGGPTHAFGMSRPSSREEAQRHGAEHVPTNGIRDWVGEVRAPAHARFAAFDTRADKVRHLPGSAAHQASRLLRRRGFRLASGPTSYFVSATAGPLLEDQTVRAARWAETVARTVVATGATQ